VDLTAVLRTRPRTPEVDRLSAEDLLKLRTLLNASGTPLCKDEACEEKVGSLRQMYEPYLNALSGRLLMTLPPWTSATRMDNWMIEAKFQREEVSIFPKD